MLHLRLGRRASSSSTLISLLISARWVMLQTLLIVIMTHQQLTPNTRVALKHDNYALHKVLPNKVCRTCHVSRHLSV